MTGRTRSSVSTGTAYLRGSFRQPYLEVKLNRFLPHPTDPKLRMLDWAKQLGGRWDPGLGCWILTGLGALDAQCALDEAGLTLDLSFADGDLAGIISLDELAMPIAKLTEDRRNVLVRPRLAGFELCKELIGVGAIWDKDRQLFRIHVGDVLAVDRHWNRSVRPGVHWPQDAIDAAFDAHEYIPVDPELAEIARRLGNAISTDGFTERELDAIGVIPDLPRPLFDYQEAGVLALLAGRTCLFDEPGVGKTTQALAAARALGAKRTLIVCPPLLTSNWAREAAFAGLPEPVVFRVGRKEPELPDEGVVVISDSLLGNRPETAARIRAWAPDVMAQDEAHRAKTIGTKRGDAVLSVAASVRHAPIAITGTPIFSSPHELVTLLELTRMLCPVFGGRHHFLTTYCRQDRFGGWHPKTSSLDGLYAKLRDEVWVRRRKRDVLPQLPPKTRRELVLEVPLAEYRAAHKDVISKVQDWVTWYVNQNGEMPDDDACAEYAQTASFELIAQLRRAAGLAKIPAAAELIEDHIRDTGWVVDAHGRKVYHRPLIVWAHHLDVIDAMMNAIPEEAGEPAAIYGATTDRERDQIVDDFQRGLIPVLVAGITKAGVGLTLTRSSDAIFAETDPTPALVKQCEDRQHRVSQENPTLYTTLIASGTLDEPIQRILNRKTRVLERAIGDTDDSVAVLDDGDAAPLTEIVQLLVAEAVASHKRGRKVPVA